MEKCLHCNKELINKINKFCSKSCAATYNNLQRGTGFRSKESKIKTRNSLLNKIYSPVEINLKQELCDYGCDEVANYLLNNGKKCCKKSPNSCIFLRRKNSEYLKKLYEDGKSIRNFSKEERQRGNEEKVKKIKSKPFEEWGSTLRRRFVLEEQDYKCLHCDINSWLNQPIVLELDHIDGNNKNNKRENLRFLCPNCHSQTPTFRNRKRE